MTCTCLITCFDRIQHNILLLQIINQCFHLQAHYVKTLCTLTAKSAHVWGTPSKTFLRLSVLFFGCTCRRLQSILCLLVKIRSPVVWSMMKQFKYHLLSTAITEILSTKQWQRVCTMLNLNKILYRSINIPPVE